MKSDSWRDLDFGRVLLSTDGSDRLMVVVQKFSTMETVCLDLNDDPLARLTTIPNRMMLMAYNLLPEPER